MSHAILPAHELEPSVPRRLMRQLDHCQRFPAILSEPLKTNGYRWLAAQSADRKLLWRDRQDDELFVAVGAARLLRIQPDETVHAYFSRLNASLADLPSHMRLFGGLAFRPQGHPLPAPWESFGRGEFWIPRMTVFNERLELLVLDANDRSQAKAAIQQLVEVGEEDPVEMENASTYQGRTNEPDSAGWQQKIAYATRLFSAEVLEKIVLARRVTLDFSVAPNPWALLAQMAPATPHCYQFGFQPHPSTAFFGATPERLFRRSGQQFLSEVVAGTRRRGETLAEDSRLSQALLESEKDQLEHHIVRKSIRQRLHSCVEMLEVDARASLLKLHNKQHLYSRVSGRLRPEVSDADLLSRLHPTPAVGGYPTENALAEIERLESFERGWYAAPVGWISREESEFVVAIRSALVRNSQMHLFSGAGIVPGSEAEAEWDEIEAKIADFLQWLAPAPTSP